MEALLNLAERTGRGLTAALRDAVADGRLAPGTRLPATRDLAADLGLSRGVVVGAYEQLVAEGRFVARRGAGTVVAENALAAPPRTPAETPAPEARALRPGVPDLKSFPRSDWKRAYGAALDNARHADLDYGDPAGTPRLREALADYLGRVRAARCTADDVVVTTGAAQAMSLLAGLTTGPIGVEDPGSAAIRDQIVAHGLRVRPLTVDGEGADPASIGAATKVFLTPAHQFPTGVVLAPRRRAAFVAWARRTGGLVIEDDYDAEFRYDRQPVGCMQGLAPDAVALIGSASKALAPGLRIGWLVVPPAWRARVHAAKAIADHGGPTLEHLAFAHLLENGGYDRHLRRVRRLYRQRRDAVVAALRTHLPHARIDGVAAGLHLVVELPPDVDDVALAHRAHEAGLGPIALSTLRHAPGAPGLVLGYATHRPDELTAAVATVGKLVRRP
ncbi:GntR family transcriptional regulator [Virgisporangium aliadipatigenens]|uniref:GntR family transcriptional regulator n=1 Tax=Virgisporangium aliadipatigenens TaxID=741659 RepID=A0A8J3YGK7_9ACTN|nr:PLP-dependent aminotransferase family protein [Virgisporangium aliadipatigenens]GIJ44809.1 GntR family transcriptional regulator [Virgisporangium aliadipatigenens]